MRSKGAVAIADAVKEGLHKLKVFLLFSSLEKMLSFPFHVFLFILLPLLIS